MCRHSGQVVAKPRVHPLKIDFHARLSVELDCLPLFSAQLLVAVASDRVQPAVPIPAFGKPAMMNRAQLDGFPSHAVRILRRYVISQPEFTALINANFD